MQETWDVSALIDKGTRIHEARGMTMQHLGMELRHIANRAFIDFVTPEQRAWFRRCMAKVTAGEELGIITAELQTGAVAPQPFFVTARPAKAEGKWWLMLTTNLPEAMRPEVRKPDKPALASGHEFMLMVESAAQESAFPLTAAVNVKLGEKIAVIGYGLDAAVSGQLLVREAPGEPTTGSGQLTVSGTYKAYGQDLTIKDGRLLFAGTPLDNPRLSITAMREIDDDLSTGLHIAGSAQRPVVTVVSDPNVGEADALSYLVTGRSLNDVGSASGSSQDALASATQSLEGGAAGLVAKRIGKRLGLDEAGVEENEMIGGSALTIGEYLSPRLYLSYGVGLFEPGEVIALRYKISSDVGVKIQRGTEETRAGVEYRIEK